MTILFDLGDVVCRFCPDARLTAFSDRTGLPGSAIDRALWQSEFSGRADSGAYTSAGMVDEINRRLETTLSGAECRALWASAFVPNPAVLEIARKLRSEHVTGLFTNNPPLLRDALSDSLPELVGFNPILFSYAFSATKPDRGLFTRVADQLGTPPERILLIDDSKQNISAAASSGWQAVHFRSAAQLTIDLTRYFP